MKFILTLDGEEFEMTGQSSRGTPNSTIMIPLFNYCLYIKLLYIIGIGGLDIAILNRSYF